MSGTRRRSAVSTSTRTGSDSSWIRSALPSEAMPTHCGPTMARQNIGLEQGLVDMDAKIDAWRDIVDVAEDRFLAVMGDQPVENPAGHRLGIGAAVGNGDLGHQRRSCRVSNILTYL